MQSYRVCPRYQLRVWRGVSVVKSEYCFPRTGGSVPSVHVVSSHNWMSLQLQRDLIPVAFLGTCTYMHTPYIHKTKHLKYVRILNAYLNLRKSNEKMTRSNFYDF